jgi:hypothetical protein
MKRRAELEERTRLRMTAAAVELHGAVGPARWPSAPCACERPPTSRTLLLP